MEKLYIFEKTSFVLLSLLAPKSVAVTPVLGNSTNKEKAPFAQSRKTGFSCNRFFCGRRHKLVSNHRNSDMHSLISTKKPVTAARSRWGPDFPWFPLGTFISPRSMVRIITDCKFKVLTSNFN